MTQGYVSFGIWSRANCGDIKPRGGIVQRRTMDENTHPIYSVQWKVYWRCASSKDVYSGCIAFAQSQKQRREGQVLHYKFSSGDYQQGSFWNDVEQEVRARTICREKNGSTTLVFSQNLLWRLWVGLQTKGAKRSCVLGMCSEGECRSRVSRKERIRRWYLLCFCSYV